MPPLTETLALRGGKWGGECNLSSRPRPYPALVLSQLSSRRTPSQNLKREQGSREEILEYNHGHGSREEVSKYDRGRGSREEVRGQQRCIALVVRRNGLHAGGGGDDCGREELSRLQSAAPRSIPYPLSRPTPYLSNRNVNRLQLTV